MLPEITSMLVLGMISGASICSLSCLHYLGPYLMGTGNGFKDGIRASAIFLLGKMLMYSIFGGTAAWFGKIIPAAWYPASGMLPGIILIIAALTIPLHRKMSCGGTGCVDKSTRTASLFGLGMSSTLQPCPTMAAVLVLAAERGSVFAGAAYGGVFGLGLALSPLILIGGGLSMISERLRVETGKMMVVIRALSVVIMISMGVRLMLMEV